MNGTTQLDTPLQARQTHHHGAPAPALQPGAKIVLMTPEMGRKLLKKNFSNRKLRPEHVNRIRRLMEGGRWKFNGDTIKVDFNGNLMDGQHRLHAIVDSNMAQLVVLVTGVERGAFATIDTVRLSRSGGDVISLMTETTKYSGLIANAVTWLCRYDRDTIPTMRLAENKVENSDIEEAFNNYPKIGECIERVLPLRSIVSPAIACFVYYVLVYRANQQELADRMVDTLKDAGRAPMTDPFYLLRKYLLGDIAKKKKDPIDILAHIFKACNFAFHGTQIRALVWKGPHAEQFPILEADRQSKR